MVVNNSLEYLIQSRDAILQQLVEMFPHIEFKSQLKEETINLIFKQTPVIEFECDEYGEITRFIGNKKHLYLYVDLYYVIENISENLGE